MRSGWRRSGGVAVLGAVLAVTILPGCFPVDEQAVLIAGHDEQGTLVVGSAACDSEGVRPGGSIWVWDPNGRVDDGDLWGIEWGAPAIADDVAFEPPPPPPTADPDVLAGVPMVAVGDPDPIEANVVFALQRPLPDGPLSAEAFGFSSDGPPLPALRIDVEGPPDRYRAALGTERVVTDMSAAAAAELVSDHCADDGSDAVRAGVITGLVSLVVVGLALAGGLWAAIRQYKRAGEAAAGRRQGTH